MKVTNMRTNLAHGMRAALILMLIQFISGCAATTQVVSHWQDPDYTAGPLKKIVVFIAIKDESGRRAAEDEAVQKLTGTTKGVASYTLYPDQEKLRKTARQEIKSRLTQEGIDGALVIRLQSVNKDQQYVPPQTVAAPYGSYYDYAGYAYGYTYDMPGYTYVDTKYMIEALVYKLPEGTMIWSTTIQATNPDSRQEVVDDVRLIVGTNLVKDGIIAN